MLGGLPGGLTPFVGRRREIRDVRRLLARSPVLTLAGPGGVGKTRLALAVAEDRKRAFPDGAFFVALGEACDTGLLVTQVANVLGQRFDPRVEGGIQALTRALRDKQLLLILDNCDQALVPVAQLAEKIARECPGVRTVVTSRASLPMIGHSTYQVPPLCSSGTAPLASDRSFDESDAARLFAERARNVVPDFRITAENRATLRRLLGDLDGSPLAIELAAAQLRTHTVDEIVQSMPDHDAVLEWSSDPASGRQMSLRASLQWSAELCTEGERELWSRLSVFRGSFDLDAVEAVCGSSSTGEDVIDLLAGLVEKSILSDLHAEPLVRYSFQDVVRHFGEEMLDERERALLRAQHRSWYLSLIDRADSEWNSDRQAFWLQTLPCDHSNIIRALAGSIEYGDEVVDAARAVCQLWRYYWWACGWHSEGLYWVERFDEALPQQSRRAPLLLLGSLLAFGFDNSTTATELLEKGTLLAEESDDSFAKGLAEHVRGDAAMYAGELDDAVRYFHRALEHYGQDAANFRVDTMLMLTLACVARDDAAGAQASHEQTLSLLAPEERFQRSYSLLFLGMARRGDHSTVGSTIETIRSALRLKSMLADPFGLAWALHVLAELTSESGQYERSAILLGASHGLWDSMSVDRATLERFQLADSSLCDHLQRVLGRASFERHHLHGRRLNRQNTLAIALRAEGLTTGQAQNKPDGNAHLTRREAEVGQMIAQGMTNRQIAVRLAITHRTVDSYVQNILTKLDFTSRAQIATWVATRPAPWPQSDGQVHEAPIR